MDAMLTVMIWIRRLLFLLLQQESWGSSRWINSSKITQLWEASLSSCHTLAREGILPTCGPSLGEQILLGRQPGNLLSWRAQARVLLLTTELLLGVYAFFNSMGLKTLRKYYVRYPHNPKHLMVSQKNKTQKNPGVLYLDAMQLNIISLLHEILSECMHVWEFFWCKGSWTLKEPINLKKSSKISLLFKDFHVDLFLYYFEFDPLFAWTFKKML